MIRAAATKAASTTEAESRLAAESSRNDVQQCTVLLSELSQPRESSKEWLNWIVRLVIADWSIEVVVKLAGCCVVGWWFGESPKPYGVPPQPDSRLTKAFHRLLKVD